MAKFTITKRLASFDMIKCGDCSSGKTTPPFFDYTIKKTPSFKNMALDMKQGPFLWRHSNRYWGDFGNIFLLDHPQKFLQNFLYISNIETFRERPHNSSAPSNEDMILAIIQIHPDS